MLNDYNEKDLDDEFVIEYHNNESVLANIAWQEVKRVCLKYIDVYADDTIKHFLKGMMIDGIKEIRKDDPESITAMNIDATALTLLIGATNEVVNTGMLEKHDAANMSDFVNKCTQEQIRKGYKHIRAEEQNKKDERDKLLNRISDLYRENEELKKRKPKKALVAVIVVLSVLLASVSGFAVYQQTQIQKISYDLDWKTRNYESSIASLNEKNNELRKKWQRSVYELMFYHSNIALLIDNTLYYHEADCETFNNAMNDDSIRCHMMTVEQARMKGYKPCPECRAAEK